MVPNTLGKVMVEPTGKSENRVSGVFQALGRQALSQPFWDKEKLANIYKLVKLYCKLKPHLSLS